MDVLVLPSLFEGIPRVIMEAAALGVPAVASDVKGNREAVADGRSGLLVPLGDVPALADAVAGVLADPERARRLGDGARQLAVERFDERRVFERVRAEYADHLSRKGLPVPQPVPAAVACGA
jgi:glycosyltransferase involved in cell wall biosynthesis